jgi:hypothetical protein
LARIGPPPHQAEDRGRPGGINQALQHEGSAAQLAMFIHRLETVSLPAAVNAKLEAGTLIIDVTEAVLRVVG